MARIGFDVSDLCTGRADGTTRYTMELARRLPQLIPAHELRYLAPCASIPSATENFTGTCEWVASPWPKYWTQFRLPFSVYGQKLNVLFMPIQQLPYLRPRKLKTVAVIHDLAIHLFPEQFTFKDWWLLRVFSAQAIRDADRIIAVSQATADDIAKYYGRREGVHVIGHGVDHGQFRVFEESEKQVLWENLKNAYPNLQKNYLLYVGQLQPRKNLERLVEAFERLSAEEFPQLVIAGSHGWLQAPILERIQQSSRAKDVVQIGRVQENLLPGLYVHAQVCALPSLYEGFGLPILEAMACGVPVVTSNVSSMPEVAGQDNAVLVDPYSVEDIASGIMRARVQREVLTTRGTMQAKRFTWDETAKKTLHVLTQLT